MNGIAVTLLTLGALAACSSEEQRPQVSVPAFERETNPEPPPNPKSAERELERKWEEEKRNKELADLAARAARERALHSSLKALKDFEKGSGYLLVKLKRRFRKTTDSGHSERISENLVARKFDVDKPNTVWD